MLQEMIKTRRFFHTIPEPAWLEFQTTIELINRLKEMGYAVEYGKSIHGGPRLGFPDEETINAHKEHMKIEADFDISQILEGYTGAVVKLDTGQPGPTIGMRFDIDANDLLESSEEGHRPVDENFRSTNPKAMHACGHDGHMTIGLFVAKWLMENREKLKGQYIIAFQPAEEGARGALSMVNTNHFDDIDYFLGMHLGINLPSGKIGVGSVGIFATSKIDVAFKGKSAHAGVAPEEGKNALLAASSAILSLHTLPQISKGMSRLNVGVAQGGSGRNIVPDHASLKMEVRGDNDEIVEYLLRRSKEVVEGAAKQYDIEHKLEEVGSGQAIKVHDEEFYNEIDELLKSKGYDTVRNNNFNASEDVTFFMNKVSENGGKSIHLLIGSDLKAGHHNDKFDFNEEDMKVAFDVITSSIEYLQDK